jgi:hypothetical protein
MTFGPYGKDVPLKEFMQEAWDAIEKFYPDIIANSSLKNLVWETPDPKCWVPDGYIIIRVDARGCGKSPGRLAPNSPEEFRDFYDAIEWAGVQPWCNSRSYRNLLSRRRPVARRLAQAAASLRALPVDGHL